MDDIVKLLTALTPFITAMTPALVAVIMWRQAREAKRLKEVHDLVNGQSQKLEALSFQAGVRKGADAERAQPTDKK